MAAAVAAACASTPPRARLGIRPAQQAPRLPADFEERAWARLQQAAREALGGGAAAGPGCGPCREEAYRLVEAMCVNGMEASLAQRLQTECDGHFAATLAALAPLATAPGGGTASGAAGGGPQVLLLLERLELAWRECCASMRILCALFLYLDRTHFHSKRAAAQGRPRSLWEAVVQIFRSRLEALPEVQEAALLGILRLVDEERAAMHDSVDPQPLLGSLISMLMKLGAYENPLEPALLERTARFYREESAELLARVSVAEYLAHCESRLDQECRRCRALFDARTEPVLLVQVREELLGSHCEQLLDHGFGALVEGHQLEDLERLYRLLAEVDKLPSVRRAWGQTIKRLGTGIMAAGDDLEESKGVVPALFDLRARLSEILAKAFQGSSNFALSLKDAFEEFLNAGQQNVPAKLLARYVDEALRNEKACGAELEETVERAMGIFRFLAAKDAFEAFFKKDLAKRLLQNRSSSTLSEAMMVQRLREECGAGFTSKLEGMYRDIEVSKGLLSAFLARPDVKVSLEEAGGVEFSVAVLTSGLWPTQAPRLDVRYPLVPSHLQDLFAGAYSAQHSGRSLQWCPLLGQCTLRASYEGGLRRELAVSHLQALVLLLFNSANSLTCREIAAATRIAGADLHRALQSLALHKTVKLLLKEPRVREVADEDVFTYNAGFTSKLYHIVVSQIPAKEQREEEANVEQRVFEDRQHEVDAAIVRIMKAKKRLTHQQLLVEVFATVSFPVQAADVKRRVESLIEREYLERDQESASTYSYLA